MDDCSRYVKYCVSVLRSSDAFSACSIEPHRWSRSSGPELYHAQREQASFTLLADTVLLCDTALFPYRYRISARRESTVEDIFSKFKIFKPSSSSWGKQGSGRNGTPARVSGE